MYKCTSIQLLNWESKWRCTYMPQISQCSLFTSPSRVNITIQTQYLLPYESISCEYHYIGTVSITTITNFPLISDLLITISQEFIYTEPTVRVMNVIVWHLLTVFLTRNLYIAQKGISYTLFRLDIGIAHLNINKTNNMVLNYSTKKVNDTKLLCTNQRRGGRVTN